MTRLLIACLLAFLFATPAAAQVEPFPAGFRTHDVATNGTTIHLRVGGQGPAVVLLHGYGETVTGHRSRRRCRRATRYVRTCGAGPVFGAASATTKDAGPKSRRAGSLASTRGSAPTNRQHGRYAFARSTRRGDALRLMDSPLPLSVRGTRSAKPAAWHFCRRPGAERLVAAAERIYLDRF